MTSSNIQAPNSSPSVGSPSGMGVFEPWSIRKPLVVLVGLLVTGIGLLFRRHNRKDKLRQLREVNSKAMLFNHDASAPTLPTSRVVKPRAMAISAPDTRQVSAERIENGLAEEETGLLLQEKALRRAAEALEAKQLAAEKTRRESEANAQLQGEAGTLVKSLPSHVTSDLNGVLSREEENRYRREAEVLRRAADELARMRQAAEALRKAEQEATRSAEGEKLIGISDLEMLAKTTVSDY